MIMAAHKIRSEVVNSTYVPSYVEFVTTVYNDMSGDFIENWPTYNFPKDFISSLTTYGSIASSELIIIFVVAILWTLLRYLSTTLIFKPLSRYSRLSADGREKMPESAWKFCFCSLTTTYCFYTLFLSGKYEFFQKPLSVWANWTVNMPVPLDIYIMYVSQLGFYLHSVFAVIYMDAWRKDSCVMIVHHLLTIALIAFSYAFRYHSAGTLVLFVHDITDVFLEFTKLNVYYKNRGGRLHKFNEWLSNIGFCVFAASWYVFRLYLFPLKILWSTGHGVYVVNGGVPNAIFFNILLWMLLLMNVYWFQFIILFLYRVATGQMNEVDDIREEKDKMASANSSPRKLRKKHENGDVANGIISNHTKSE